MHSSRVLLADDHPILAAAIGEYVAEAFQLVGTVRDGGALLEGGAAAGGGGRGREDAET